VARTFPASAPDLPCDGGPAPEAAMDNSFILRLQTAYRSRVTWRTGLEARLIKLFNRRSGRYTLKFKRDDWNRYYDVKRDPFDPSDNLLQGGMISVEQAINIYHLLSQVISQGIPGEVVELGCYEGTTAILMQHTLDQLRSAKRIHVYDSFQGLPDKTADDGDTRFERGDCRAGRERLLENVRRQGVRPPEIHAGWFHETLPRELPERLCFVHLDADFYASILCGLESVYPRLAPGAIVLVDDCWDPAVHPVPDRLPGVRRACDAFLAGKPERLHVLIGGCASHAYFRKA
jgi:O-methyltransferase